MPRTDVYKKQEVAAVRDLLDGAAVRIEG